MQISPSPGIHTICLLFLSHLFSFLLHISVVQVASFSSQSSLSFPTLQTFTPTPLPNKSQPLPTTTLSSSVSPSRKLETPLLSRTTPAAYFSPLFSQELNLRLLSFPGLQERAGYVKYKQRQPFSYRFSLTSVLPPCRTHSTQITRTRSPLFSSRNFYPRPFSVSEEENEWNFPSQKRDFSRKQRLPADKVLEEQHAIASSQGRARLGVLRTVFGNVETPNFIFCGTKAAVKGVSVDALRDAGTQVSSSSHNSSLLFSRVYMYLSLSVLPSYLSLHTTRHVKESIVSCSGWSSLRAAACRKPNTINRVT